MRCGLFGKLGVKRDFIALATPRSFLEVWEPWLQSCLSASQHRLGDGWRQAYLTAPVWRFWLGASVCGATTLGAIMPSLDGVGRYYPLTLHAVADAGCALAPPDVDAQDEWFAQAETFLLSTLDEGMTFEAIAAALDALAPPRAAAAPDRGDGVMAIGEAMVGRIVPEAAFGAAFAELRNRHADIAASATFWWTAGGGDFPPLALACRGLPDPFRYDLMLAGDLVAAEGA